MNALARMSLERWQAGASVHEIDVPAVMQALAQLADTERERDEAKDALIDALRETADVKRALDDLTAKARALIEAQDVWAEADADNADGDTIFQAEERIWYAYGDLRALVDPPKD